MTSDQRGSPGAGLNTPHSDPFGIDADGLTLTAKIALALVALCAPVFAALTFELDFTMNPTRSLSLPVLAIELTLIVVARIDGFRFVPALRAMPRGVLIALSVWAVGGTLASVMAANPSPARIFFAFSLLHVLLAIALWDRFSSSWKAHRGLFLAALTGSLLAYVAITQVVTAVLYTSPVFNWDQFGVGVVNIRHLGFYGVALAGLGMGYVASRKLQSQWWPGLLVAATGFYFVAWTGGRSPFLSVFVTLFLLVAIMGPGARLKVTGALLAVAALVMPVSLVTAPPNPLYGLESIIGRVTPDAEAPPDQNSVSHRTEIWADTLEKVIERPIIGHGQSNWSKQVESSRGQHAHPHNLVMQVLYDWGLVGALALLALGLMALWRVRRWVAHRRDLALPAIGGIACLLVMSMADGPFFFAFPQFVVAVCVAVLASIRTDSAGDGQPSRQPS